MQPLHCFIAFVTAFALIISGATQASGASKPVKVFILAGQSNMEGQAVTDLDGKDYNDGKGTLARLMEDPAKAPVFAHLRGTNGKWAVRDDVWVRYQRERSPLLAGPLGMGFSVYGDTHHFGAELQFGHVIGAALDGPVLLIKMAWGGKSLHKDFRPPSSGGESGPYFTKMIAEVREALTNVDSDFPMLKGRAVELAGFVWWHGWNDGVSPKVGVPEYETNLLNLIRDVRRELGVPKLPVVIGELTGPWRDAPPEWERLRQAQATAATRTEFAAFVGTRDFVRKPEESPNPGHGHHEFGNAETYFLVGDALGHGMLKLLDAPAAKRVLFLGNSITLHGPAPAIGWTGNWGMAASAAERDYVHLLAADLAKSTGMTTQTKVKNIADFERGYAAFDVAAGLKAELEFDADIVVMAIGENVAELTDDEARAQFAAAFTRLLATLKQHGAPAIFVRSCFWPNAVKDKILRDASAAAGATFVDIAALGRDPSNAAKSERKIEHAGVAGHPGDKGMRAIADTLFAEIQKASPPAWPQRLIGYTELRTDLPGGRHANVRTMRAAVVRANGTGRRLLAAELADGPEVSTQFAGWSPDGALAVIHRGWKSAENAAWEEQHKTFRFTKRGCLLDAYLVNLATGRAENVTGVERVSFYNSGVFFWPGDAPKLGFTAMIGGNSHPFRMDRDGRNKTDLTRGADEFTYGFNTSRDGKRIAYHKNYQVFLADADGANAVRVETGKPFNFGPTWSPDGKWVLFVSGEHYDCHPHIVRADGTGLRKIADRAGYRGVIEFLDVPDFHGGSSDTPVWSTDSARVFYTAKTGENVELFAARLDGTTEQLTKSATGALHYHPQPSPDGAWLLYGSKRAGVRQLHAMRLADQAEKQITTLPPGHAAMWPHWQPDPASTPTDERAENEP